MTEDLKLRAEAVLAKIEADIAHYNTLPDTSGRRVHCLFAGLYRETTAQWLTALEKSDNPGFAYRALYHFYEVYDEGVVTRLNARISDIPRPWRNYHRLARWLTMRSPITSHLILISLGLRAHTRHDLGISILRAAQETHAATGVWPDIHRHELIGDISRKVFFKAALDYVDWHHQRQRGWRRGVLAVYVSGLRGLRFVWLPIMEAWRDASYRDALASSVLRQTGQPLPSDPSAGKPA